ncbi:MAG TPA: PAS domain-containing protein [Caulobacter sp.]|nr:PAS domain-containing protein [Caulobacter sp.]
MSNATDGSSTTVDEPIVWRLIPLRPPPALHALLVTVVSLAVALGLRLAFMGFPQGLGASSTFFPAFIAISLYAGARWGWGSLLTVVALGWLTLGASWAPRQTLNQHVVMALFTASGAVTVWVALALRDALIRIRRETSARGEVEAMLRVAEEAGGLGVWDWNLTGGTTTWSPGVYQNLGLAARQTPPGPDELMAAVHPDDRDKVDAAREDAIRAGKAYRIDYRTIGSDGQIRWVHARGRVHRDEAGQPLRLVGYILDVTERYQAAEKLRESEERFRALADSAPALLWLSRLGGARDFVNTAYADFVGDGYEAALTLDWRTRLHPDDLQRILREQVAGESSLKPFSLEGRYRRGDGEWRWLKSFSQPRFDPAGQFEGFAGIAFDVTDAKAVEADLQRINDLLAERVEAALAERDEAQAALSQSQKLEALGQLTGGVAHDFNNLLTVIIGALDMVQRHPEDAARTARLGKAALDAAHRGERLTRQLLAFSRRQPLRPEPAIADELIRDSEPLLRRALGERHMLDLDLRAQDRMVKLDRGQFDAAIMNLLVNARDAMESGGGVATLSTRLVELDDASGLPGGTYLSVRVHDTGEGMDEATRARVFEPFFSTKPVGKGTGLGLSQVYGFVRQSGGSVEIDSAPGQGATITLLLPTTAPSHAAPAASADRPRVAETLNVLLVEDDPQVGALVETMLRELGHEVDLATNAEAALTLLGGTSEFNLMLTDVVMPGDLTGVDLAHRAVTLRPGLPIVLSSGYTGEALTSAEEAPWPVLRKPYTLEGLAKALDIAVEGAARQYVAG